MRRQSLSKQKRIAAAKRGWKRFLKERRRRFIFHAHFSRGPKRGDSYKTKSSAKWKEIQCPENFSLLMNEESVISFMSQVRNLRVDHCDHLKIDLSRVIEMDNLSIMMLLSNINHASQRGIFVCGNNPENQRANDFFEHSGFLSHMTRINKKAPTISTSDGLIVNLGRDYYRSENADNVITQVINRISGSKKLYQRLNGIVGEMGGNAIQYAYNERKHYLFGSFTEGNKMSFVFADSGYGILNTLKRSFGRWMADLISAKGPVEVLRGAFDEKYGSRTGEDNRNRGLPFIKQTFDEGLITNLMVISNNVLLDFEKPTNSRRLDHNYSGTVYFWQIDN